jgi:tRNA (guanine-N7-)-methyltransferase
MKEPRRIEREFGVPIAGQILEPPLWTRTALKHLPTETLLPWEQVFGRRAPVVLDLGCGNGRFLISSAVWRPDLDHLGLDILAVVIRYATRRANQRGLTNIRFAVGHAATLLQQNVACGRVREIHCYHPQPYYDPGQVHRRLITPEFLALVQRALEPGGSFFIQTDNPGYWRYIRAMVPLFFDFHDQEKPWPDAPKGRTRREIIALRRGLPVFRGWGNVREGLSEAAALELARSLPPPTFDASRQLRELDRLEKQAEN